MAKLVADAATTYATDALGWVGVNPNDPKIAELREELLAHNGLDGLEVLAPDEVERAAQNFYRDGYVVVKNVLDDDQVARLKAACDREMANIAALDLERIGNRGSHRYSFGSASLTGSLTHLPEWRMLIDIPTLTPILTEIFQSDRYIARGAAGDFCLPGAFRYQPLHTDTNGGDFTDPVGKLSYRDLPAFRVCCNFAPVPFTAINGATRQIAGTQYSRLAIPTLDEEPAWMKRSTISPAPAGSVLIRDIRAWHGGTPNVSNHARAIPNVEYCAPWWRDGMRKHLRPEHVEDLSDFGRKVVREIMLPANERVEYGYREDFGNPHHKPKRRLRRR